MMRQFKPIYLLLILLFAAILCCACQPGEEEAFPPADSGDATPPAGQPEEDAAGSPDHSGEAVLPEEWLTAAELNYAGLITLVSTVDELKDALGEPDEYRVVDDVVVQGYHVYRYGDVEFHCLPEAPDIISLIVIIGPDSLPITREIKYGDSFADTLAKFPAEQDYRQNADGIFYGGFWTEGPGGAVSVFSDTEGNQLKTLSLTTEAIWPSLKMVFDAEDRISRITIIGEPWT